MTSDRFIFNKIMNSTSICTHSHLFHQQIIGAEQNVCVLADHHRARENRLQPVNDNYGQKVVQNTNYNKF